MASHESRGTPRGRGTAANPPNRFDTIWYVADEEARSEDDPAPRTHFLRDPAKSIIAYNESPDVGFDAGINPYRGCEHGCVYCLCGETPILMADGTHRRLADLRVGDEIYGTTRRGWYRRFVKTTVLAHWETRRPAYRVTLGDGTTLTASGDHRFLTSRGWKFVTDNNSGEQQRAHLTTNDKLMGTGGVATQPTQNREYMTGYLSGIILGDGLLASYEYARPGRASRKQHQFRLALADNQALDRTAGYLRNFDIRTNALSFSPASATRREIRAIRTHSRGQVERIRELVAFPTAPARDWSKGFLAGIWDAEGSYSCGAMRIPNADAAIIGQLSRDLGRFDFRFAQEQVIRRQHKSLQVIRVTGGVQEHLRFFHTVDPAISRKRQIEGVALKPSADLSVRSIEPLGKRVRMFDITTGTGDFIANGVVSHNCYARPTHEYLGFSSGLDFETKILVKEHAPKLLRRELTAKRWKPQPIAVSGNTDAYQPGERRFELTRGCLEVLAELRNPVVVITKNHLVTRDVDHLKALAAYDAAMVCVSVTTLDGDLARVMEPRTSHPVRRLEAIRTLSSAGIPTGVLVAPIIPGLTDSEIPAILKAAAEAGATFAGSVMLRLPHSVEELFDGWLAERFPDRKKKIQSRIRAVRGGRMNDPNFKTRMRGEGVFAEQIAALFDVSSKQAGIPRERPELSTAAFRRREFRQGELFED